MHDLPNYWYVVLMLTAFIASYVDSIAGGGGMIQTPMLIVAGLNPVLALGTNKVASMIGTAVAVTNYARKRLIPIKWLRIMLVPAIFFSYIGAKLIQYIPPTIIIITILLCIPVAFFFVLKKKKPIVMKQMLYVNTATSVTTNAPSSINTIDKATKPTSKKAVLWTSIIAFYDGLIGPGTGTYLAILGNRVLDLDFVRATALAKPINLATNVAAAIAFIMAGKVLWPLAIPMAICSILGGYAGSHFAIKNGEKFIKKIMIIMLIVIMIANIAKLINSYYY